MKSNQPMAFRRASGILGWALVLMAGGWGCSTMEPHPHEYAAIQANTLTYGRSILPAWPDEETPLAIPEIAEDPAARLVWIVYFAPWCPNWRYQAPIVASLADGYRKDGLRVIGISEYGSRRQLRRFFGDALPSYPVAVESEDRADRLVTSHFQYRQQAGDARKWGSPWNLFYVPHGPDRAPNGPRQMWVANGEVLEAEAEAFIRSQLGL